MFDMDSKSQRRADQYLESVQRKHAVIGLFPDPLLVRQLASWREQDNYFKRAFKTFAEYYKAVQKNINCAHCQKPETKFRSL